MEFFTLPIPSTHTLSMKTILINLFLSLKEIQLFPETPTLFSLIEQAREFQQ